MIIRRKVNIRNSVATRLLKVVFCFYIAFALLVTLSHMFIEYSYQKGDVNKSLVEFQPTIESTLAMNLWHMDDQSLKSTIDSIIKIPLIVGIKIKDESKNIIAVDGVVSEADFSGKIEQDIDFLGLKSNINDLQTNSYNLEVFQHTFPIYYRYKGQQRLLGEVTLFSNSSVIFDRVKVQFLLLVINSVLKSLALWVFFLLISNYILRRPLESIAEAAENISVENLSDFKIKIKSAGNDELSVIENSFNEMIKKLSDSINKQKGAEQNLRENEIKFRTLVENVPGVTYRCINDEPWTMIYLSDEIENLSGYQRSDFINNNKRTFASIIHIEDTTLISKAAEKAIKNRTTYSFEYRIVRANGEIRWVYEKGQPIFDENGELQFFDGVIIDITERKQAESEIRKLRKYLTNIIDSMPSSLVGVDESLKITQWNKTIEDTTGIAAVDAYGKSIEDILPQMQSELGKISCSLHTRTVQRNQIKRGVDETGICYEDVTIYPLIANGVKGAVIRIDDITEKVRMEEILIQSEKMLSVGGLAAGMAHEINNPLAGMVQTVNVMSNRLIEKSDMPANIEAAKEAGTTIEAINKFMHIRDIPRMIATINESGKRASAIVNNMLSFARKGSSEKATVNYIELVDNTIDLAVTDYNLKSNYDFKQVDVIREYKDKTVFIECEPSQIQQVILNLIRNAAQAMQDAKIPSPKLTVRISHDKDTAMVQTEIEDNGPGIDKETLKRIFEPFYTTKPVGVGTGLGLSVSYFIIADNHNGEMHVESVSGQGTRFTISLPVNSIKQQIGV